MSAVIENHHDDHDHGPAKGITRCIHNYHKDIGTLYLCLVLQCSYRRSNGDDN